MNGDSGGFDWGTAIMVGENMAERWYSLITGKQAPPQQPGAVIDTPLGRGAIDRNTIVIVAVAVVAAVVLLKR